MKRILIINVNWLGDVLFSTPFIRAVRKKYPADYIACMVVPRCKPILELNPNIDEIIVYDEDAEHKTISGKIRLISTLRSKKFDAAFILHRSLTRALITFLSGIKIRIGYGTKGRGFLLTHAVSEPPRNIHKVDYFLNIAESSGIEKSGRDYEFFISDRDRMAVDGMLAKMRIGMKDRLVVINPGGNWDPKRWPKENFARVADYLAEGQKIKIVINGAAKDRDLAEDINLSMMEKAAILCGKTSIKQLGALMERADLVISNDSGPMHIAASMKRPVLALFGPTSHEITGPCGKGMCDVLYKDIGCDVPCYDYACRDNRCMRAITPEEVFEKAKEMLHEDK